MMKNPVSTGLGDGYGDFRPSFGSGTGYINNYGYGCGNGDGSSAVNSTGSGFGVGSGSGDDEGCGFGGGNAEGSGLEDDWDTDPIRGQT